MAANLPADLREAAGRAAFLAHALRDGHRVCSLCDGHVHWTTLTDEQREEFRASQDPALSVLAPVLAECATALRCQKPRADGSRCMTLAIAEHNRCAACRAFAHLAALGVRP